MTESNREIDTNGFVEIHDNPISKVGVYPYLGSMIGAPEPERIYAVLRPAEELSRQETLDSLRLMPLLDDHLMVGEGESPAEEKGIHGVIGENIYFKDDTLYGNIKIHSESLLDKIDNEGKRELSAGYRAEHEFTSGEFNGEHYDAIQKDIIFNHVALVDKGRMGSEVAVLDNDDIFNSKVGNKMAEGHIDKLRAVHAALGEFLGEEEAEPANTEIVPVEDEDDDDKKDDDKEKVEDCDEVKDEDDDEKKDDEKKEGVMDAALVAKLVQKQVAQAIGGIGERDKLYADLKPHIGIMDNALSMTKAELSAYAVKKLGLACQKGHEESVLQGYLLGVGKRSNVGDSVDFDQLPGASKTSLKEFE